jgi:hypothetical protein
MAVDAINGGVQGSVVKPFDGNTGYFEIDVFDLGERFDPINALAMFAPEFSAIVDAGLIHRQIFVIISPSRLCEVRRYWE